MMAGTITDPDIARRLLDYADELSAKAREHGRDQARAGLDRSRA